LRIDLDAIIEFLVGLFRALRDMLSSMLQKSVLRAKPEIARMFGDYLSLLVALTAIYLIMCLISSFKKIFGFLVLLGWALFLTALLITSLPFP